MLVAVVSSNTELAAAPGNVLVRSQHTGLSRDSVVNVSQVVTLDRRDLISAIGRIHFDALSQVDDGLRLALEL